MTYFSTIQNVLTPECLSHCVKTNSKGSSVATFVPATRNRLGIEIGCIRLLCSSGGSCILRCATAEI